MLIAIDAGHGSYTAGKRTPDGYKEHTINVKCATYFEQAAKRCGFKIVKIGFDDSDATDDIDFALSKRQQIIREYGAQVSVSWHANAYGTNWNAAEGVETYIHSKNPRDSKRLALKVQEQLIKGSVQTNRGVKTSSFAMVNCYALGTQASILIELGFMTNKREAELMKTEAFCKESAEEACKGLCAYAGATYKPEVVEEEVVTETKMLVEGKEVSVKRILKDGENYIRLRDIDTVLGVATVGYNAQKKLPVITKIK